MKKNVFFALLATLCMTVTAAGAIILSGDTTFKLSASDNYTCDLPTGYTEISDVEAYAIENSDEIANPYTFRGTVTKVVGDEAYIQRRNYTTLKVDSLKITNFQAYSYLFAPGNVVDINGGNLSMSNGQPVFTFTGSNQMFVSFNENPTGYGPKTYQSFDDIICEYDNEAYAYSKLDTFANNKYISHDTVDIDGDSYTTLKFEDLINKMYYECLLLDDDATAIEELISFLDNLSIFHGVSITGIYTHHKGYSKPYFIVSNTSDISDGGVNVDTDIVDTGGMSLMISTPTNYRQFKVYTLKGKDSNIYYVNFSEFYYEAVSFCILNPYYSHLNEFIVSGTDNYLFAMDVPGYENYLQIVINPVTDTFTIYRDNLGVFTAFNGIGSAKKYVADGIEQYCNVMYTNHRVDASQVVYNLGDYNIDIVKDKYDNMYIPVSVISNILLNSRNISYGWNGDYLFNLNNTIDNSTLLGYWYYDSQYMNVSTRTQEFANFTYDEFRFTIENFYGLYEKKILLNTGIDEVIEDMGLKTKMLSTSTADYEDAVADFGAKWVADGHARYLFASPYNFDSYQSYTDRGQDYSNHRNDRCAKLFADRDEIASLRNSASKDVGLDIYDDTAVIRFDAFKKYYELNEEQTAIIPDASSKIDLDQSYSELHNLGSDLLFRRAFNDIIDNNADPSKTKINNIVVDLTLNGGGMLDVIPYLEAYFEADPTITVKDMKTGAVIETEYMLDLDYDGVFGDTYDDPSYGFKFYLLTSNFSFSCGNYFPTVIKEHGSMTIIGETSGGGECAVGLFATACGTIFRNSSVMHLGYYDSTSSVFVGNDDGIAPDYEYPRAKFYDLNYLDTFLVGK